MAQTTIGAVQYEHTELVKNVMGAIFRNALVCSSPRWTKRGLQESFDGDTPIGNRYKMRNPQRTQSWAGTRPVYNVSEYPTYDVVISNQEVIAHSWLSWEEKFFRLEEAMSEIAPEIAALTSMIDLSVTKGQVSTEDRAYGGDGVYLMNATGVDSTGAERAPNCFTRSDQKWGTTGAENQPFRVFSDASARFHAQGIGGRQHVFLTPQQSAQCADLLKSAYNPERTISDYFHHGSIEFGKPVMGISSFMDTANMGTQARVNIGIDSSPVRVRRNTSNAQHADYIADGATQFNIDGIVTSDAATVLPKGTILGFNTTSNANGDFIQSVNFQTREPTGYRMDFVVLEDVTVAGATTAGTSVGPVKVFPPLAAGTDNANAGVSPADPSSARGPIPGGVRFAARGEGSKKNQRMASLPPDNAVLWINGVETGGSSSTDTTAIRTRIDSNSSYQTGYLWTPGTIGMMFVRLRMPKREEDAFQVEMPNSFSATTVKSYDDDLQFWSCKTRSTWGNVNARPEQSGKFLTQAA